MPGKNEDVLLAMISSKIHQFIAEFDDLIDERDPDFAKTRLKVTSVVRLSRLMTVEKSVIVAKLGEIDSARLMNIYARLIAWPESLQHT